MSTLPPLLIGMALITVSGVLAVGAVLYRRELALATHRLLDRAFPSPEQARSRPIEQLARDLARVRNDLLELPAGTPMPRRRGVTQAYDDLLAEACTALDLDEAIADAPPHLRDVERLRVEQALDRAGIPLRR